MSARRICPSFPWRNVHDFPEHCSSTCRRCTGEQRRKQVQRILTAAQRAALPAADEQQLAAAEFVHYGKYVCDEKIEIFVERDQRAPGYVDVRHKKDIWVMKPVASATGAVRLEDIDKNVLLVQIPYKSMLLNVRSGQRIVDSCQHDNQLATEKADKAALNK